MDQSNKIRQDFLKWPVEEHMAVFEKTIEEIAAIGDGPIVSVKANPLFSTTDGRTLGYKRHTSQ